MSTEPNTQGSSTPEVPASPTVTAFQQVADTFLKQIEAMSASMPDLQVQHPAMTRFIRKRQNVPTDFLSTVVAVVEQTPVLQGVTDPAAARNALQYIEAFKPVVARISALRDALEYTIRTKKASLGVSALQTYGMAKNIARNPMDTTMLTHVADMQRDLKRKGIGRKKATPSTETPQPTPQTPQA